MQTSQSKKTQPNCPACSKPMRFNANLCSACTKARRDQRGGRRNRFNSGWYKPCSKSDTGRHSPNLHCEVIRADDGPIKGRLVQREFCTACLWERIIPYTEDAWMFSLPAK